jgi:hypothetical protein
MRYQFEQPFIIDASDAERIFGLQATALDEQIAATLFS